MSNRYAPVTVISGRPAIGLMGMTSTIITGSPELGCSLPKWVSSGRRVIGDGEGAGLFSTTDIGARKWAFLAGSIRALAFSVWALKADVGTTDSSSTTEP